MDSNEVETVAYKDSLGFRLSISTGITILITLVLSILVISWITFQRDVDEEINRVEGIGAVIAASVAEDLVKNEPNAARRTLSSIRQFDSLLYAGITKPDGTPFAQMGIGTYLVGRDEEFSKISAIEALFQDKLWISSPIIRGGEPVGHLKILSSTRHLRFGVINQVATLLLIALLTVFVAISWSSRSINKLIYPLRKLSKTMLMIGGNAKFNERVDMNVRGEVGALASSFNTMIAQIEARDQELSDYQHNLENMVKERTEELKNARDIAENANAAKSDFLATMSHEIRTPMNGMMVMAEMLTAAPLSPKHRRYANIISRSGKGLLNIINDVLDFSKIEAGQLDLESTPFSIDSILGDVANLFWDKAQQSQLELLTYVDPRIARSVIGDPTRFNQIVTNLVNNALKFTQKGGVTINAHYVEENQRRCKIRMEVIDTGIGIARDKQEKVFQHFSQADQSTTREYGGTGLGLSICRKLVHAMGGEIGVQSQLGFGSTFWFEIELDIEEQNSCAQVPFGKTIALLGLSDLAFEVVGRKFSHYGWSVTKIAGNQHAALLATSAWMEQHRGEHETPPLICLTSIGDSKCDALIEAGTAKDIIDINASRQEFDELVEKITQQKFSGKSLLEAQKDSTQNHMKFGGLKVLAVDDNAINREVLKDALSTLDVKPTLAESGERALEILEHAQFDLIFMDCSMPGMDGFEATQRIRQSEHQLQSKPTPVVALTAHISGTNADKWKSSGMNGYLTKPFTIEALTKEITQHCAHYDQDMRGDLDESSTPASSHSEQSNQQAHPVPADNGASSGLVDAKPETDHAELNVLEVQPAQETVWISDKTLQFLKSIQKGNTNAMAEKIFGLYRSHVPHNLKQVKDAAGANDFALLAKTVHALKSMSLSAGAEAVAQVCQKIEDHAKHGDAFDYQDALAQLEYRIQKTVDAMDELLRKAA